MKKFFAVIVCVLGATFFSFPNEIDSSKCIFVRELSHATLKYSNVTWKLTAYCPWRCCNMAMFKNQIVDFSDQAAVGGVRLSQLLKSGIGVVAVDPSVVPLGSIVQYGNRYYVALDTGSAIRGFTLDFLYPNHESAEKFGVQYSRNVIVYVPQNPKEIIRKVKKISQLTIP